MIRDLVNKLNYYTDLYNQGKPKITDEEWDKLYFELQKLEKHYGLVYADSPTQSIRPDVVSGLEECVLPKKMLSLAKTKSLDEINDFIGKEPYVCSLKLDGLSCELVYRDGKLVSAFTRGNGVSGSNVTHSARVVANIPQTIPYKGELIVCGEVICKYNDFEVFSADYANPRNFASGSLKLLDANECKKRKLSFIAWELLGRDDIFSTYSRKLMYLSDNGFEVVPHSANKTALTDEAILSMKAIAKDGFFPIDGLVIKYDNCSLYPQLGETATFPNYAKAFKFYDEAYETELLDIEWTMGRDNRLTPIAVFKPVKFPDSICERASLHNVSIMKDTFGEMPFKGQRIKIAKMNEIIPQITDAQNEKGEWINEFKTKISSMEG